MFWYCVLALFPLGLMAALRRDALVTTVLTAYAFGVAALVALTGGNIGTLVRHRGLALPYPDLAERHGRRRPARVGRP